MFDLSHALSPKAPPTAQQAPPPSPGRPEVTGLSPREGPTNSETRLVIRGCHLGQSASDVVGLTVAGHDCLATLDYDSSTRITCLVGPAHSGPAVGDVIVETCSGGLGISLVQFRFVDTSTVDEDQFTAVPYDSEESQQTGPASLLHMTSSPAGAAAADAGLSSCRAVSCICLSVCLSRERKQLELFAPHSVDNLYRHRVYCSLTMISWERSKVVIG